MILHAIVDLIVVFFVLFGLFFMALGAIGLIRMPDLYHRMHAATKGVTLGIMGLLVAAVIALSQHADTDPINIITKALLVILFQFVANPVGAHILAKAAHLDRCPKWSGTLSDELESR